MNLLNDDDSCSSDDADVAFAYMDFAGVDFDTEEDENASEAKEDEHVNVVAEPKTETKTGMEEKPLTSEEKVDESIAYPNDVENKALVEGVKTMMFDEGENAKSSGPTNANLSSELATIIFDRVTASVIDLDDEAKLAVEEERYILLKDCYLNGEESKDGPGAVTTDSDIIPRIRESSKLLSQGQYIDILSGPTAQSLFEHVEVTTDESITVAQRIRHCVLTYCSSVAKCVEVELMAVAALNVFMQANYTGPALHHGGVSRPGKEETTYETLKTVNPHPAFASQLNVSPGSGDAEIEAKDENTEPTVDASFHNSILAELSVDGEWPCPVCKYPYFLLLARSILSALADPNKPHWTQYVIEDDSVENQQKILIRKSHSGNFFESPSESFVAYAQSLACATIWCGRAIVAHSRLLQGDEPAMTLWKEAKCIFDKCVSKYCDGLDGESTKDKRSLASKVMLEYGLAEHHFDRDKMGKPFFQRALEFSDRDVEVTGAEGRRTKYQQKATAQMLVRAKPTAQANEDGGSVLTEKIGKQEIKFEDDTILFDKVKFVEEDDNTHFELNILQLTVLLALCLDVKNDNPMDGLTGGQMGAYLERVLQQHDDWMVYATGLLERAWLESERNHTRERALLQLQALADQHTNRLTITQSTFQAAVEDSAPPQERLRNIHYIVYPPRWEALRDLAQRYASIGIVTSAAEIFEEIELWDEVVECYKRAGKSKKAEEVIRKRLAAAETPRMWAALGDITGDKSYYEKALEVSNGKFSSAHVALGNYYTEKGDLEKAVEHLKMAVRIKPLSPHVWFRLGALSMRLKHWETALQAYTEVVQQEPEEGDAWANVAAIHMHNRNPGEAYPALNEVCICLTPSHDVI